MYISTLISSTNWYLFCYFASLHRYRFVHEFYFIINSSTKTPAFTSAVMSMKYGDVVSCNRFYVSNAFFLLSFLIFPQSFNLTTTIFFDLYVTALFLNFKINKFWNSFINNSACGLKKVAFFTKNSPKNSLRRRDHKGLLVALKEQISKKEGTFKNKESRLVEHQEFQEHTSWQNRRREKKTNFCKLLNWPFSIRIQNFTFKVNVKYISHCLPYVWCYI